MEIYKKFKILAFFVNKCCVLFVHVALYPVLCYKKLRDVNPILSLERSGKSIINTILFQKYRVLSLLGSGGSSNVYLAEHIKLKDFRAIKCIPKTHSKPPSFFLEASLLKSLRHSGIPTIYDVEEDDTYLYLIEEYIHGESLSSYLQNHDNISLEHVIFLGIELCKIIEYLHNQKPNPILYLDLKPEHIILCGKQLKLIDFGIAISDYEAGNHCQNLGTVGFAAPEQYKNQKQNVQTDIYGIGAVLYYMLTKELLPLVPETSLFFPRYCSRKFKNIIRKATKSNMGQRYKSVIQLRNELEKELMYRTGSHRKSQLLQKIIIAGSQNRIGTTHIAISFVCWLNANGYTALYEEKTKDGILGKFTQFKKGFCEQGGIFCYRHFQGKSSGTKDSDLIHSHIIIRDYGDRIDAALEEEETDMFLLVIGSREWEIESSVKACETLLGEEKLQIICNYNQKQRAKYFSKIFQKKIFCFPLDVDSFVETKEKDRLFAQLAMKKKHSFKERKVLKFE